MKNNSKFKRIIAGFLCAVLSLGALPMSAFAFTAEPGKTCEAFYGHKYTGSDGNTYHSPESYQAIHYDIAVFKTFVYSNSPDSFKYYHFVDAENEDEFNAYVEKCRELSLYDTGVSAEYGDKLISLSTCEYSRTNGRLVVVAKLVK